MIDLNADVGEGMDDEPLLALVSSVNVACGGHAGDLETMGRTVRAAGKLGIAVGAHPGYEDPEHFGRRALSLPFEDVVRLVAGQVRTLSAVAAEHDVRLRHVKPHGALYNQAAVDAELARAIVAGVREAGTTLAVVGLAGSALVAAARAAGSTAVEEAFADRRYLADGTLAPRGTDGAVIEDPAAAAAQALAIARGEEVETADGAGIHVRAQTICLHSDTPGAVGNAKAVRAALEAARIEIVPV